MTYSHIPHEPQILSHVFCTITHVYGNNPIYRYNSIRAYLWNTSPLVFALQLPIIHSL